MITTKELFGKGNNIDDKSLGFLTAAIEKNNLPGFDYYEFKRAVAALTSMKLEEDVAHKSAFATAQTVGLTKEKLIETAQYYRNLIEQEKTAFDEALSIQQAHKVTAKETEMSRLQNQIERNKAAVERLQEEIADYAQQIEQAEASINSEKLKLEKTQTAFSDTQRAVLFQIDTDIENLHKYL